MIKVLSEIVDVLNKIDRTLKSNVAFDVFTDATRPAAADRPVGYTFYNSGDFFTNTSDGTNWRNPSGVIT